MYTFDLRKQDQGFVALDPVETDKIIKVKFGTGMIEAHGAGDGKLVDAEVMNGLVAAIHRSYTEHLPLALSPDDIWLAIAQGLSLHINANAETLRHQFVSHEGKARITVRRDGFVRGRLDNDWPGVFHEFSDQIAGYIHKKRDLIVSNFTTTGPLEKVVSEITLMEAMKNYFDYRLLTMCHIPRITLLGETSDWEDIARRVSVLAEFDLSWWTDVLLPIVDKFVDASKGKVDTGFWENIYKRNGGSGGPYITGWITQFFPYAHHWSKKIVRNNKIGQVQTGRGCFDGMTSNEFSSGLSVVPFVWEYYADELPMEFVGGFLGVKQEADLSLRPALGWVVRYSKSME